MALSRRKFLTVIGSSAVILAAGSGAYLATRTPAKALAPWKAAGRGYSDPRREALSYAILAPNPHNRQPWLVDLVGEDEIVLYCDLERRLPMTDPFNRQITIGLGCFLEILRLAAQANGYRADISPFPEGEVAGSLDDRPVAHIKLVMDSSLQPDPLFASVLLRRSNKEEYDTAKPIDAGRLRALDTIGDEQALVNSFSEMTRVQSMRDLTWRAFMIEIETPRTYRESIDLMRIGKSEINANPDGIDLGGPLFDSLYALGQISRDAIGDPNSIAYSQGMETFRANFHSAMGYFWITTPGNSRQDQLAAGRIYVRTNLAATGKGLDIHPLSQALQEYPEMTPLNDEINTVLGTGPGQRIQMLARLGYGPQIGPSPRWPAESRIRGT